MAARTSTSIGVGITVTILGVATLALFVLSMVFFAQRRSALEAKTAAENTTKDFLSDADRSDAQIQRLKDIATKERKTVVGYMLDERKELMQKVTGSVAGADLASVSKFLSDQKGTSMFGLVQARNGEIDSLKNQLKDANDARERALLDKENEAKRVKDLEEAQRATIAALTGQVNETKAETDTLRDNTESFKKDMDARVDRIKSEYASKESALKSEIEKLQAERAVDKDRLRRYEIERRGERYSGQPEYALVDAQVVATNPVDNTIMLSIGTKDKVVLGLTFNIYAQGTTIKPDDKTGQYPAGKATVEVIRVENDSATARVLREQKGNPILRGDFAANPVYDPAKKYKFLVYGSFDAMRTGIASPLGANDVKAWIREWGGDVVDELTGDVDFVVLGQRPQLPPAPGSAAPLEVINFYLAQQRLAQRYDELFKQAADTAIPVLNENRLRTLLGR